MYSSTLRDEEVYREAKVNNGIIKLQVDDAMFFFSVQLGDVQKDGKTLKEHLICRKNGEHKFLMVDDINNLQFTVKFEDVCKVLDEDTIHYGMGRYDFLIASAISKYSSGICQELETKEV